MITITSCFYALMYSQWYLWGLITQTVITLSSFHFIFIQLPETRLARTTNVIRMNFIVTLVSSACTANTLYLTLFTLSYNLLFVKQIKNIISISVCILFCINCGKLIFVLSNIKKVFYV